MRRFCNVLAYRFSDPIAPKCSSPFEKASSKFYSCVPFPSLFMNYCAAPNIAIRYIPHFPLNLFVNRARNCPEFSPIPSSRNLRVGKGVLTQTGKLEFRDSTSKPDFRSPASLFESKTARRAGMSGCGPMSCKRPTKVTKPSEIAAAGNRNFRSGN